MKTPDKLSFTEFKVEYRHGPRHGSTGPTTEWQDASGYNNQTGTYYQAHQVRAQITRTRRRLEHLYHDVEFRVLTREVVRTEWQDSGFNA